MNAVVAVDPGALTHHANRLAGLASAPRGAGEAARSVSAPGDAFGLVCAFIGEALEPFGLVGAAACDAVGEALEATAEGLRSFGDDVVATDVAVGVVADGVADRVEAVVPLARATVAVGVEGARDSVSAVSAVALHLLGNGTDGEDGWGGDLARWSERLGAAPVGGALR